MRIELPEPCLVVLMGASGSGKSTFAAAHFPPTEVISSDACRALVADDANDQSATEDAFAVLTEIASRRLRRGRRHLQREGFRRSFVLKGDEDVSIARAPMWTDRRAERGPFDIVGDVHGCDAELGSLLSRLGYVDGVHPDGRRVVFLGDLVDRGPSVPAVLRRVMAMVEAGNAFCVPGNHDSKLARKLAGRDVQVTHGLAESLEQLSAEPPAFVDSVREFLCAGWCRTPCSTAARWWSRTPGCSSDTRGAARGACASSRCTARPRGRPTSSACPCAAPGRRTTAARPPSSTGTHRSPSRRGSTTRSTSTPAACSAGG